MTAENRPTTASVEASVERAKIYGRRPFPPFEEREIPLFIVDGDAFDRRVTKVAHPTHFDEVLFTVFEAVIEKLPAQLERRPYASPLKPRALARDVLRDVRRVHSTVGTPYEDSRVLFDARWMEPNNVAHSINGIFPFCLAVQRELGDDVVSVFAEISGPAREAAQLLGVRFIETTRRLQGRIVEIHALRELAPFDLPRVRDMPAISVFPEVYDDIQLTPKNAFEKVYISRRGGGRSVANGAEVEALLKARGYQTIYAEDYPIEEQLAMLSNAKHAIGIHGAGMAWLSAGPPLDSLVELLMPHQYQSYFPACLHAKAKRIAQILPTYDPTITHAGWTALRRFIDVPFHIPLGALEAALDEVGG